MSEHTIHSQEGKMAEQQMPTSLTFLWAPVFPAELLLSPPTSESGGNRQM